MMHCSEFSRTKQRHTISSSVDFHVHVGVSKRSVVVDWVFNGFCRRRNIFLCFSIFVKAPFRLKKTF